MKKVSPFIKWVGGKSKLISEIDRNLPDIIKDDFTYVEPFLGGGAVFFHLISNYKIKNAYLNDLNIHLINTYIDLRDNYRLLCKFLKDIQLEYENSEDKKNYYLNKRKEFNSIKKSIEKSSLFIFLNKTGFNGMYRENSKGEFNIPFGDMKNPKIFNKELLSSVSILLNENKIEFSSKSFEELLPKDTNCFYYLDPPYRPISKTSSFTDYTKSNFNDEVQKRLKKYCDNIDLAGNLFLQSNSYSKDQFFQKLYKSRIISKLEVTRTISADGSKRKKVSEILIRNYES
jgi:DNA adenine methylase